MGGVLAPNGMIYGIPYGLNTVLKIDPTTDTATTFGSMSAAGDSVGSVLAPNGLIYGMPYSSTRIVRVDPTTDTILPDFGSLTGVSKWAGGVLGPDGTIYGIPDSSTTVLKLTCGGTIPTDFPLSRFFNKF